MHWPQGSTLVSRNWSCPRSVCICVSVSVSLCPPPRLLINSGMMWHDMDPMWLVNKLYSFCMAAIVSIISRHGLTIETRHRKQPNKGKLALYHSLLHFYNHLKQLYISNKMEHFGYKGGCGIRWCTRIKMFNTRADLGYR